MFEKKSKLYVIAFALGLSLICSMLITAAASGLKKFQQENIALDKKVNLLRAASLVAPGDKPPKQEISRLFDTRIREVIVDSQGQITQTDTPDGMHLYFIGAENDAQEITGYILPITTRGLWGKIQDTWPLKTTVKQYLDFPCSAIPRPRAWAVKSKAPGFKKTSRAKKSSTPRTNSCPWALPRVRLRICPRTNKAILWTESQGPPSRANICPRA